MDSLHHTKDVAAKWVARRGGEDWSAADQAELDRWLKSSTNNLIAYLRLESAWKEADRLKALGAGFNRGFVPALEDFRASPFFKHVAKEGAAPAVKPPGSLFVEGVNASRPASHKRWAIAASILIVIAAGFAGWTFWDGATAYSTPIGVTAAVPLSDGSKITLNTDSAIRVAVNRQERKVELEQGEAFFEIVPDPARPFTVDAGDKRIVVLGTKFSVRRERDDVKVIVTEGKVRVEQTGAGPRHRGTQLSAGNVASAKDNDLTIQERTPPQAEELLSWRSGYVVFHETSLVDAVGELNRYNNRKFIVKDPGIAAIRVSGNFRATNVDSFVRLLEDGFPVAIEEQGERIFISQTRGKSPTPNRLP